MVAQTVQLSAEKKVLLRVDQMAPQTVDLTAPRTDGLWAAEKADWLAESLVLY